MQLRRHVVRHFRAPEGWFWEPALLSAGRVGAISGGFGRMSEADGLRQRRPLRPQVVTDDGQIPEVKEGR